MSDKRPTEQARQNFDRAKTHSAMAHQISAREKDQEAMYRSHSAVSLQEIAEGLGNLTTGLRATYILLEEVKRLLERQPRM